VGSYPSRRVEDRLRTAYAIHDDVIQRLFAIGIGMQSLLQLSDDPFVTERLNRYIAELDETIAETRRRMLELREVSGTPRLFGPVSSTASAHDVVF